MPQNRSLVLLSDDPDLRVSADDTDPTGWTVVDAIGQPRGTIIDLVVATDTMKVVYMLADTTDRRRVLFPAAVARLDPAQQLVIYDLLTPELLSELPDFMQLPLSDDEDARIHRAFTGRDPIAPDHTSSPDRRRATRSA